ncbi:MAG: hypothetical protein L6Q57_06715 [Alphaproteobacteria bacterium]|nr:hypothetical protein [Alphaproteobacteria bacterium]
MKTYQSGNILFFILIAVVLLAGLTMVLSRSSTSVNQTGSVEHTIIDVSAIKRYAAGLAAAVQALQSRGCSENDISFENPIVAGYENTGNPSNESCFVFSEEGAGLVWREPSETDIAITPGTNSGIVTGFAVSGIGAADAGNAGVDLLYLAGVTEAQCTKINADAGIGGSVSTSIATWTTPFLGSFTAGTVLGTGGEADGIAGHESGCITMTGSTGVFYQVLLAR